MTSVYLAGPIAGKSFAEAVGWRDEAVAELTARGYTVYAPMRNAHQALEDYDRMPLEEDTYTYVRDIYDVDRADIVVVNWLGAELVSLGTAYEMGYAAAKGKFILTVIEPASKLEYPLAKDGKYHPFIEGGSSMIVHSMARAYEVLDELAPAKPPRVTLNLDPLAHLDEFWPEEEAEMYSEQAPYHTTEQQQLLLELETEVD